jgi:hypothetical protein
MQAADVILALTYATIFQLGACLLAHCQQERQRDKE